MRIVIVIASVISCLLPSTGFPLTNREAYELLIERSIEIKEFPFHVYVMPDYAGFQGVPLPVSSYSFFAPSYEVLKDSNLPGEVFATYHFSQGTRWRCFLLRVPGMYAVEAIDIWIFDTSENKWQKPMKIAEWWGDAGYSIDVQAWIEDLNKDGWFDIVVRTLETDINWEDPQTPTPTNIKKKDTIFIWNKNHFEDASREYLPKIKLDRYRFKKYEYQLEPFDYIPN